MEFERRLSGLEIRAEGRRLSGTVMRFGDVSPSHRERFEPGSIRLAESVHLDLHHDPERAVAWHPGGGLELDNGRQALAMRADLPPIPAADRALAEIRAGRVDGLSVEFRALSERREGEIRVIEEAVLAGIGIVRSPSYGGSRVEARAKSGRTLRAVVPVDRELQCECIAQGGAASACRAMVRLEREVMQPMADMIDRAFAEAQAGVQGRDVLAVGRNYGNPIASARRGTLRAVPTAQGLDIEADLPSGRVGDDVVAASETAGVIARPLIDYESDETEFVDTAEGRVVTKARLRAILIGATDSREGWPDARIAYDGNGEERLAAPRRRERRLWL